jgi:CHAT domain-containing protein
VQYSLDLPPVPEANDRSATALVVADSAGDLPAAAVEGRRVAQALDTRTHATLLVGERSTRAAVLAAMKSAGLFHYAGHAMLSGPGGWQSALALAHGERLEVADILELEKVPSAVVLSGCETARSGDDGLGEGIGVSRAFLLAGASFSLAAMRPVRDDEARSVIDGYYASAVAPPEALRAAQLAMRTESPRSDWAAFRVMAR